jgi:hypothetical protein
MPRNFDILLQSFDNNVGGQPVVELVQLCRSSPDYLKKITAEANIRNILNSQSDKREIDMQFLDAFYLCQLSETEKWTVLLAVCNFDHLWLQLQQIDKLYQAQEELSQSDDDLVHESRTVYDGYSNLLNIFTEDNHLFLTETAAHYSYKISSQSAAKLSSAGGLLEYIDEATIDFGDSRINVTPRPDNNALIVVIESTQIKPDSETLMLELADQETMQPDEIDSNGDTTLVIFKPVDFSKKCTLLLKK